MAEGQVSLGFNITFNFMIRGDGVFMIKKYCKKHNLELDIIENKKFLYSDYHMTVKGYKSEVILFQERLKTWAEENSSK